MHIYYAKNNQQIGPITISDLKPNEISKETLVWYEGLVDWVAASEVDELKSYFSKVPPPLPKTNATENHAEPDTTQEIRKANHVYFFIIGLFLIVMNIYFYNNTDEYSVQTLSIGSFVLRVLLTILAIDIAKSQKRSTFNWGWFTFFFPIISCLYLGLSSEKVEKAS